MRGHNCAVTQLQAEKEHGRWKVWDLDPICHQQVVWPSTNHLCYLGLRLLGKITFATESKSNCLKLSGPQAVVILVLSSTFSAAWEDFWFLAWVGGSGLVSIGWVESLPSLPQIPTPRLEPPPPRADSQDWNLKVAHALAYRRAHAWFCSAATILRILIIPDHCTCLLRNLYASQQATELYKNKWLVQNWERNKTRQYIVTLLI